MIGIPLGLLIGLVSGFAFILLVKTAWQNTADAKTIFKLSAELFSIPTFWFGGPWCTTAMFKGIQLENIVETYMVSLACTFLLIAFIALKDFLLGFGNAFKNAGGPK